MVLWQRWGENWTKLKSIFGDSYEKMTRDIIEIDGGELPFTIDGIIATKLRLTVSSAASGDKISVLSFH